jgi:hypothetical protein
MLVFVALSVDSGAPDVTVPGVSVSGFTPVDVSPVDAHPHMAMQRIERAIKGVFLMVSFVSSCTPVTNFKIRT